MKDWFGVYGGGQIAIHLSTAIEEPLQQLGTSHLSGSVMSWLLVK